jgi:hypothetical protein
MAVTTAATPIREHEQPMSWPRAILIATGFFFITAILVGQLPSYFFTISTLSTLARFEQGTLALGLLGVGFGLLSLEIAFLYDPKPLIPWPLFALVGLAAAAIGLIFVYQVAVGLNNPSLLPIGDGHGWGEFIPTDTGNGHFWPTGTPYIFHPAWFQLNSIDISAVGMIAILVGLGMVFVAVLNPFVLAGRLAGPARDLIVRFSIGLAFVIVAIYVTVYTFAPDSTVFRNDTPIANFANVMLFVALILAMLGLGAWLLPIMATTRQRFMPASYLHGVVGLLGSVGIPLLVLWVIVYPVVNLIRGVDPNQVWVQCSQKTNIPASCTFTPFTGYIICAIVFSITFGLLFLGLYFWSTRRDTIVLGATIGMLYLAIAVTVVHLDDPLQVPMGLLIATCIAIGAFVFTWSTQREFASTQAQQLGCLGQWLVLGTLLLIYLFGFALFSMPNFFEIEALALFYQPGHGGLHDAFWALLLMGGFAAFQLAILVRRRPMSTLRKFAMWVLGIAVVFELIGAIQGFHTDVLTQGIDAMQGSQAFFLTGGIFQVIGILACLIGALRARSIPWALVVGVSTLIGLAVTIVMHSLVPPYPELVVFGVILASVGSFAYVAAGPDYEEELGYEANGNGESSFVVTR